MTQSPTIRSNCIARSALQNQTKVVQHADDSGRRLKLPKLTLIEAREMASSRNQAMHAFILSTNATPQE